MATCPRTSALACRAPAFVLVACVLGCGASYAPGSLLADGRGVPHPNARRLECLDMRVQVVRDRTVNERWPVLDYEFGNGCDRSIRVHLQRAHVTARWNGHRRPLEPFDPRDEIGSAVLDARARGSARIAYVAPDDARGRPTDVCVDLQEVELEGLPRPVCFVRKEGRMIAVDDVGPGKEGRAR